MLKTFISIVGFVARYIRVNARMGLMLALNAGKWGTSIRNKEKAVR